LNQRPIGISNETEGIHDGAKDNAETTVGGYGKTRI